MQRNNPSLLLLVPKQMDQEGEAHHNAGYPTPHRATGSNSLVVDGEQGQERYDSRSDVLLFRFPAGYGYVASCFLTGTTRSAFGQSIDFCRRMCLGGGRVIITAVKTTHLRARFEACVPRRASRPAT